MKVPLEILIYIFTLATRSRGSAVSWMLYQQRSMPWFEKQLYEKVLLSDEDEASLFVQCLRRRQLCEEFAETVIKAISLSGDINVVTIMDILSLCKGIKNLSLRPQNDFLEDEVAPLLQLLDTLPLKVLSHQIGVPFTSSLISNVTLFAKITHLEVDDPNMLRDVQMSCFPQLTHLSLWGSSYKSGTNIPSLVKNILANATLEVIIFRVEQHQQFADFLNIHELNDPRIVLATSRIYLWDDLGRSCMLFWELAEEKAKSPNPNHNNHRCFTRSALTNGVRDFMGIERVPEDHLDYEIVRANVIGEDGRVRTAYFGNAPGSSIFTEESDDDMDTDEDYSDDDIDEDETQDGTEE
ncbi:uncharacterized protein HD556DRAFT_1310898 [Suillus plorans]|uniref:Uncharacterized protein n=1 Tax=Suillus plorans TaxID=116603 RepID=A0A9P7DEX6_9AGAM|nr:uncharacterized protein HD556DRAFT_1310898 [Suillus plorans]KAG1790115.1 hypothetical protein HD556DRAFT_1310898 [Suillus plorans]